jgi:hypothetical protein
MVSMAGRNTEVGTRRAVPIATRDASTGGFLEGACERVAAQAHAGLDLWRRPASDCESMKGAGNDMKLRRHAGTDEATRVFQIFFEKQIERADGYARGRQSG